VGEEWVLNLYTFSIGDRGEMSKHTVPNNCAHPSIPWRSAQTGRRRGAIMDRSVICCEHRMAERHEEQIPMSDNQDDTMPGSNVAIFEGKTVRRQWVEDRWYFSVIDVVGLLAEAAEPRVYWSQVKTNNHDEGFVSAVGQCKSLKMRARDGKLRATDCADFGTMLAVLFALPIWRRGVA
jgi:hypothetical protein